MSSSFNFYKKKRRRIIVAKFATVIEELVALIIICLLRVIFSVSVLFAKINFTYIFYSYTFLYSFLMRAIESFINEALKWQQFNVQNMYGTLTSNLLSFCGLIVAYVIDKRMHHSLKTIFTSNRKSNN